MRSWYFAYQAAPSASAFNSCSERVSIVSGASGELTAAILASAPEDVDAELRQPRRESVTTAEEQKIDRLEALTKCLDAHAARYAELRGAADFGSYLTAKADRADEETLTEPVLALILERVLGFPTDGYFPQLGKGGQKPDFTPIDLIAHPFVLDAKSSTESLDAHEGQIRRYMRQRGLDYGILFNLREVVVFQRGVPGPVEELSFGLLPLWELARAEAMPTTDASVFAAFCKQFAYRELTVEDKIEYVRAQPLWAVRLAIEDLEVDVEALVERLRRLARLLAADAAAQEESLDDDLRLMPGRERRLIDELRLLAIDLAPGVDAGDLPDAVAGWRTSEGLAGRAWRQYLLRVAYLALTRILLYRAWEDVEFAPSYLYDGGFGDAYERLSQNARNVLREALQEGADRYRWLYGPDNNYDWYRPREPALVEVVYSLAPIPLGKLDADVLGGLYVSYVDEIDRDRLGQFFTPRPVVRFMLNRAGFDGPEGVFRVEGDRRRPVRMLDFATGSGGFVVEAARRIIDQGGIDIDEPRDLLDALQAVSRGIVGGEISPFPYYLTEVNLLLQVSRLLGYLGTAGAEQPRFVLGVLHTDTLTAKGTEAASLEGIEPHLRADHGELVRDEAFGLAPLDGEKLETYRDLKRDGTFDLVVGNPPYVAEANNKPLFDRLRAIPAWKGVYRGKTDYLYYFLWLAVEKLAPGGRLVVITPAGWMNAGAADFLRAKLASELRLDELFLFGSYRLFADEQGPAPTPIVESAILVATKAPAPDGHALRVVALEDEAAAGHPARDALLEEMAKRAAGEPGRDRGIHVHDLAQSFLHAERPWPIKHTGSDLASRDVGHLETTLADAEHPTEALAESWKPFMGVQTCADAYSKKIDRLNSELLDLWYGLRGRVPRDIWRDYEPKPMRSIPYRRPDGDPRAEQVAELVRRIADNRRALLPHRAAVRDLGRIVKDPWKSGPVEIDRAAVAAELDAEKTVSIRIDPTLQAAATGKLGKPKRESPSVLGFRNGRVEGDPRRLDLLEGLLDGRAPDDLLGILLPKDLDAFERLVAEREKQVQALLAEGRELVEEVERLVCALYDVPEDLTEEIVEHAVRRAGASDVDSEE